MTVIVDIGSHSLKVYRYDRYLALLDTVTWHPLGQEGTFAASLATLAEVLQRVRIGFPDGHHTAVGTALLRTHPELAAAVSQVCARNQVEFEVISHEREAQLIRAAAAGSGLPAHLHVVNVGGKSIQIVPPAGPPVLLTFGIVDLNCQFGLTMAPARRQVEECVGHVQGQLPAGLDAFAYTGGELTYLRGLGLARGQEICGRSDFEAMAARLAQLPMRELEKLSPYDPAWMSGAVASNCVVLALLRAGGADHFVPSDLNIAQGLIGTLGERHRRIELAHG